MAKDSKPFEAVLLRAAETLIDRAIDTHLANPRKSRLSCGDVERLLGVIHHLKAISIRTEAVIDAL